MKRIDQFMRLIAVILFSIFSPPRDLFAASQVLRATAADLPQIGFSKEREYIKPGELLPFTVEVTGENLSGIQFVIQQTFAGTGPVPTNQLHFFIPQGELRFSSYITNVTGRATFGLRSTDAVVDRLGNLDVIVFENSLAFYLYPNFILPGEHLRFVVGVSGINPRDLQFTIRQVEGESRTPEGQLLPPYEGSFVIPAGQTNFSGFISNIVAPSTLALFNGTNPTHWVRVLPLPPSLYLETKNVYILPGETVPFSVRRSDTNAPASFRLWQNYGIRRNSEGELLPPYDEKFTYAPGQTIVTGQITGVIPLSHFFLESTNAQILGESYFSASWHPSAPQLLFAVPNGQLIFVSRGESVPIEIWLNRNGSTDPEIRFTLRQSYISCGAGPQPTNTPFRQEFVFGLEQTNTTIVVTNLLPCPGFQTSFVIESEEAAPEVRMPLTVMARAQVGLCCTNVLAAGGEFSTEIVVSDGIWARIDLTAEIKSNDGTLLGEVPVTMQFPTRSVPLSFSHPSLTNGGTITLTRFTEQNRYAELGGILTANITATTDPPVQVGLCCSEATARSDGFFNIQLVTDRPYLEEIIVEAEVRRSDGTLMGVATGSTRAGQGVIPFWHPDLVNGGAVVLTRVINGAFARVGGITAARIVPESAPEVSLCCDEGIVREGGSVAIPLRTYRAFHPPIGVEAEVRLPDGEFLGRAVGAITNDVGFVAFSHPALTNGGTLTLARVNGIGRLGGLLSARITNEPPVLVEFASEEAFLRWNGFTYYIEAPLKTDRPYRFPITVVAEIRSPNGDPIGTTTGTVHFGSGALYSYQAGLKVGSTIHLTHVIGSAAGAGKIVSAKVIPEPPPNVGLCCEKAFVRWDGFMSVGLRADRGSPVPIPVEGEVRLLTGELLGTAYGAITNGSGYLSFSHPALTNGGTITLTRVTDRSLGTLGGILTAQVKYEPPVIVGFCCGQAVLRHHDAATDFAYISIALKSNRPYYSEQVTVVAEVRLPNGQLLDTITAPIYGGFGSLFFGHLSLVVGSTVTLTQVLQSGVAELGGITSVRVTSPLRPILSFSQPFGGALPDASAPLEVYLTGDPEFYRIMPPDYFFRARVHQISGERRDPEGNLIAPFSADFSIWAGQPVQQIWVSDLATDATFALSSSGADIGAHSTFDVLIGKPGFSIPVQVLGGRGRTRTISVQRLDRLQDQGHVLRFQTQDGSARAGVDYTEVSGEITFLPHERTKEIQLQIPSGASPGASFHLVFINDDVSISNNGLSEIVIAPFISLDTNRYVLDASNRIRGSVQLDGPVPNPVIARLSYPEFKGLVTIPAGETTAPFEFPLPPTGWDASVYLEAISNGKLQPLIGEYSEAVVLPHGWNDELAIVRIEGSQDISEGLEGSIYLYREGPVENEISLSYSMGGRATPGEDYEPLSGQVTFGAGVSFQEIRIQTLQDYAVEGLESVTFRFESAATNIVIRNLMNITIRDEEPGEPVLRLGGPNGPEPWLDAREGEEASIHLHWNGSARSYRYFTTDLAGRAGQDYEAIDAVVTNALQNPISIRLLDDPLLEAPQDFLVTVVTEETVPLTNSLRVIIHDNEIAHRSDPTFVSDARIANLIVDGRALAAVRQDDSILLLLSNTLYLLDANGRTLWTNTIVLPEVETGEARIAAVGMFSNNDVLLGLTGAAFPFGGNLRRLRSDGTWDKSFHPDIPSAFVEGIEITPDQRILAALQYLHQIEVVRLLENGERDLGFEPVAIGIQPGGFGATTEVRYLSLLPGGDIELQYERTCFRCGSDFKTIRLRDGRIFPGETVLSRDRSGNGYHLSSYGDLWRTRPDGAIDPDFLSVAMVSSYIATQSSGQSIVAAADPGKGLRLMRTLPPAAARAKGLWAFPTGAAEGKEANVAILRVGDTTERLIVSARTVPVSATPAEDFVSQDRLIEFAPSQIGTNLSVLLLDDQISEGPEEFLVQWKTQFEDPTQMVTEAVVQIFDNDGAPDPSSNRPGPRVRISRSMGGVLLVDFSEGQFATSRLQISDDLSTWTTLAEYQSGYGSIAAPEDRAERFYRVEFTPQPGQ